MQKVGVRLAKLIMMSLLIATVAIPMRHAGSARPKVALKRAVVEFCWFNLFYVLALVFLVPRIM
jgi:hypothetical protein